VIGQLSDSAIKKVGERQPGALQFVVRNPAALQASLFALHQGSAQIVLYEGFYLFLSHALMVCPKGDEQLRQVTFPRGTEERSTAIAATPKAFHNLAPTEKVADVRWNDEPGEVLTRVRRKCKHGRSFGVKM
jgi:hypothetical protein